MVGAGSAVETHAAVHLIARTMHKAVVFVRPSHLRTPGKPAKDSWLSRAMAAQVRLWRGPLPRDHSAFEGHIDYIYWEQNFPFSLDQASDRAGAPRG